MVRVFVYGTLKRGEPNHKVLSCGEGNYELIDSGRTVKPFSLIITSKYNIPVLLDGYEQGKHIYGEVYEVDEKKLEILDELEAYPTLYTRKEKEIELDNGNKTCAWIYMLREWREDIFESSTSLLENYSSKGSHGREYVERYARAKDLLNDESNDLYRDIQGISNAKTRQLTLEKAQNDMINSLK